MLWPQPPPPPRPDSSSTNRLSLRSNGRHVPSSAVRSRGRAGSARCRGSSRRSRNGRRNGSGVSRSCHPRRGRDFMVEALILVDHLCRRESREGGSARTLGTFTEQFGIAQDLFDHLRQVVPIISSEEQCRIVPQFAKHGIVVHHQGAPGQGGFERSETKGLIA